MCKTSLCYLNRGLDEAVSAHSAVLRSDSNKIAILAVAKRSQPVPESFVF